MFRTYKYEVVKEGSTPTWDSDRTESFMNPVSVGEFIKPNAIGRNLIEIIRVEHYPNTSVLYYR